jgi:hypothetical protein
MMQIKRKLAIYRAKAVWHADYETDTVQISSTKDGPHKAQVRGSIAGQLRGVLGSSNTKEQSVKFLGERGYYEIPEEIQAMMRHLNQNSVPFLSAVQVKHASHLLRVSTTKCLR